MTAFNYTKFQKWSQSDAIGCNKNWNYTDASSTLAQIGVGGYFNDVNNLNPSGNMDINDVIYVVGSDGNGYYIVTAISPNVTISPYSITVPAGSIVNADVNAAAAIAFSKLAALPSTQMLVGSAGNVPTAVAVTGDVTISNTGVTAIGANKVSSTMISPLLIKYVKVNVTAAQWNGMFAAPKLLLANAGANTEHRVFNVEYECNYGGAAFANGGNFAVQYDSTVNGAGVLASVATTAATAFWVADSTAGAAGASVSGLASAKVNKGLYLSNITQAFDTGTSDVEVHLWYSTITTTL